MIFGIFCCINFTFPYFIWEHESKSIYDMITIIRFIGASMACLLIIRNSWNKKLKPFFPIFWHITLLYCLPFITTVMVLLTNAALEWIVNISISIFFLVFLVDGAVFLMILPLGIGLGIIFYSSIVGPINLYELSFTKNYLLVYQIFVSTVIGLLFGYRKKLFYMIKGNQGINLGIILCSELKKLCIKLTPFAKVTDMYIKKAKITKTQRKEEKDIYLLNEEAYNNALNNNKLVADIGKKTLEVVNKFDNIFKSFEDSISNPETCSLRELVEDTIEDCNFDNKEKKMIKLDLSQDFRIRIPKKIFSYILLNIIKDLLKYNNPSYLKIWIESNELHIRDNGKGINKDKLNKIFNLLFDKNLKTQENGINLGYSKHIIESFNGEIICNSRIGNKSFTEVMIKFPEIFYHIPKDKENCKKMEDHIYEKI